MKKIIKKTKRSEDELEQAFQSVQASLAIEGLILTEEEKELVMSNARGEISEEEFMRKAYKLATGKEWPPVNDGSEPKEE